jgi:hypothetical protein
MDAGTVNVILALAERRRCESAWALGLTDWKFGTVTINAIPPGFTISKTWESQIPLVFLSTCEIPSR